MNWDLVTLPIPIHTTQIIKKHFAEVSPLCFSSGNVQVSRVKQPGSGCQNQVGCRPEPEINGQSIHRKYKVSDFIQC